ncbi:GNAT family N-acetyltransferase [Actinocatenispora rupis]|uniref:N-acetyltransferase n=1 Tax=Actinocatenispora rupis TaxID=519421 RepID=A0A8J3IYC4_9ACTN|nr:GNAT family protein [Actinocatenispora rupis]GID10913.1 N-acetyltransferase [Actinocatenispora rupis]
MLVDLWPPYGLTIVTPTVQLRLPREEEIAAPADVAAAGVHRADERPFLTPWAEGDPADRARTVLQGHWDGLASWRVPAWELGLGVFRAGEPIGMVSLRANDFPIVREVVTSSWLGLPHQGRGYGTDARLGLLTLAFDHLGARAARTEVFRDNHASQGVSRKLGYVPDGISVDARGDEALVSDRLRLTREVWTGRPRAAVTVEGFDACRALFGL